MPSVRWPWVVVLLLLAWGEVAACEPENFVVAIDVGHSPRTRGATSSRGTPEWEFNQALAGQIRQRLWALGFRRAFLITGENSLIYRPYLAERGRADLLLSVHHDSVRKQKLKTWTCEQGSRERYCDLQRGHSLFVSRKNPRYGDSLRFAQLLGQALLERHLTPTLHHALPDWGANKPLLDRARGVYQYDNLVVLRESTMPALLFEAGVIVNRQEEQLLQTPGYRELLAEAVGEAVRDYCVGQPVPAVVTRGSRG